ncbi:hypothetical protein LCI18_014570 [Fusarium solani-melongenae]|uniref:Uncharacterized protein n=1 Tax=Fusarium solani subsp. cucurbitae TaxID=2747967 RepID=A0ACD3ZQY6_FUSSC|nr:hypothetical protein LCI18_014570 [Fusarium solani-melongenae]
MTMVYGKCDSKFREVQVLLKQFIESGKELGASITVNVDGEEVVDIWGGYANESRTQPWEENTIVNVFSCSKTVLSLAALILVDRGLLDLNEKVAHYWPEFQAQGKGEILVRNLLSHTAGISGWDDPISIKTLYDIEKSTTMLADQAPWWTPGTASGYHALSMGHLLGELVRRTSGKTLREFISTEIAGQLDVDFQFGASEQDWPRISNIVPPKNSGIWPQFEPGSIQAKTLLNPPLDPEYANTDAWRRAELGAVNGHGNSRSLARILSIITLGGSSRGKCLLSESTIRLIFQEQQCGQDLVLGMPFRFGIGFGLTPSGGLDWLPEGNVCFWGGWGGSFVIMDLDRRMTIAYTMNKMGSGLVGSDRATAYGKAVYKAVSS